MKRWIIVAFTITILVLLGFFLHRSQTQGLRIKTARVTRGEITKTVTASGSLKSARQAELKFEATGKVMKVLVGVGEKVQKGQVLAYLDQEDLRARLHQAEAALDKANERRNEFREAHKNDAPSEELFSEFAQYDADVRSAEAQLQEAQVALRKANLVAPFSGTVTAVNLKEGELPPATGKAAIVIADLNPENLYFETELDEEDLKQVKVGQNASVTFDASKESFLGTVKEIAPRVSLNDDGDKIIKLDVYLQKPLPPELRKTGLSGDAEITVGEKKGVLILPNEAILQKDGKSFAWRIRNGRAERVELQLGLEDEFEAEVISGLNEGDIVATEKLDQLTAGQRIKTS